MKSSTTKSGFLSKLSVGITLLLLSIPSFSNVIYQFDFSNLSGVQSGSGDPFSITLSYSDYVTDTGLKPLAGTPKPTTLGYSVSYAGTNSIAWWAFDDDGAGQLDNNGYSYGGLSFLAGFSIPSGTSFITSPGTYFGWVNGNAPYAFSGDAKLTVSGSSNVPEPTPFLLLVVGIVGLALGRRKIA